MDRLAAGHRAEALAGARRILALEAGFPEPRLLPLSARDALAAKEAHEPSSLAASGLPRLEAEVAHSLEEERRSVFLTGLVERASALPEEVAASAGGAGASRRACDDSRRISSAVIRIAEVMEGPLMAADGISPPPGRPVTRGESLLPDRPPACPPKRPASNDWRPR